jgi:hypothetical protein
VLCKEKSARRGEGGCGLPYAESMAEGARPFRAQPKKPRGQGAVTEDADDDPPPDLAAFVRQLVS